MHISQKSGKSNIVWAGPFLTPKYMVVSAKVLIYTHSIRFGGSCCLVLTLMFYHIVSPPSTEDKNVMAEENVLQIYFMVSEGFNGILNQNAIICF